MFDAVNEEFKAMFGHPWLWMTVKEHAELLQAARQRSEERCRQAINGHGDGGKAWQAELDAWPVHEPLDGNKPRGK